MLDKSYGFEEFKKTPKSEWLEKLVSDIGDEKANQIQNFQLARNVEIGAYADPDENGAKSVQINSSNSWNYLQTFSLYGDEKKVNSEILDALNNGADGLWLVDLKDADLNTALNRVDPKHCVIGLVDIIDLSAFEKWLNSSNIRLNEVRTLLVECEDYLDLGIRGNCLSLQNDLVKIASPITELSYLLSLMVDCIEHPSESDESPNSISNTLWIRTSLSSSYFVEVAKLRALGLLVDGVLNEYGVGENHVHIHADCQNIDEEQADESNYLHCTTQAMAAIAGGADSISIMPNIEAKGSDRIARNISNLLRDESHFAKVTDPAAGSYYVESLTDEIARKAWEEFAYVQKQGGMKWALENEYFEKQLALDLEFNQNSSAN